MKIYLERENKTINFEIKTPKKIIDILKELNITLESVILIKNDEIALEEEIIENNDHLKLLSVVSGG